MIATVRDARVDDAGAIEDLDSLANELASELRGGEALLAWDVPAAMPLCGSADWHVAVGVVDDVVLALARTQRVGDRAVLHQLFTHPQARRVGLGHLLLIDAQQQAGRWGCRAIDSVALPGDRATKNFFEAHAMKSRLLVVHAPIELD